MPASRLALLGAAVLTAGCSLLHSGPPGINGLSYKCAVGTEDTSSPDLVFHPAASGPAFKLTFVNTTGKSIKVNGYDVTLYNSSGSQVSLLQFSSDGTTVTPVSSFYIDPGQSTGIDYYDGEHATSCKLAEWH